jgi:5'(3')-deoxyribonucleotidase
MKYQLSDIKILLDMDGVLADFIGGACHYYHRSELVRDWPLGEYDICKVMGYEPEEFWRGLCPMFWLNLLPMPDMQEIIEATEPFDTCILTSPTFDPQCAAEKISWINAHVPRFKRQYLIGPAKPFCAAPNHILVDDSEKNCLDFEAAGGRAVMVPRPWNHMHRWAYACAQYVESHILETAQEIVEGF